jgi:BlaI family transcriptional regulator, penicillinase repressor
MPKKRAKPTAGKAPRLGAVQLQIMQVLWQRGQATAREVTEELSRTKPTAHSTVQTLLRQLETKGAVTHEVEDRTFVYRPVHQQNEVATGATRELLARLFNHSVSGLVAHLLKHETISQQEMQRLRQLIEEADQQ